MLDEIDHLIQREHGRIFIDIATEGCGSGCSYCYINKPLSPQALISRSTVNKVINELDKLILENDILSFCPNTEPLKSVKSREYVYDIIRYFRNKNVIFQISTKESIPESYLEALNELQTVYPIYIFISIPFLETNVIEPHAASLEERKDNFKKIHKFHNLRSCLYIKPYNSSNMLQKEIYWRIITDNNPDEVCVGVRFMKSSIQPCLTLHHAKEVNVLLNESNKMEDQYTFTEYLSSKTRRKIFFSSVCIIAHRIKMQCILDIDDGIIFCKNCTQKGMNIRD